MEDRSRRLFWVVVAVAAALLFVRLGSADLMDPDEARFARTSVEMSRNGDLVVPTFEGAPRIVKPPLLHWVQVFVFRWFGPTALAARLPSALATLGSLFLVAWVARRRFGEEGGAWAAAIFITLPMVMVIGRLGTTDALLSVHILAALALDMAEPTEAGPHRGAAIGALLGLAFLAKGPVGVILPLLVILGGRTAAGRNLLPHWRTVPAFVAGWSVVAIPWILTFTKRISAGQVLTTLRTEVLERYFAGGDHAAPPWYYGVVLVLGFFPWVAPMVLAIARVLARRRDPAANTALYAGAGLLAGLLFFSLGRGKLPQYILPLAPLVALLVTWELGQELSAPRERRLGSILLTGALLMLMILLAAAGAVYPLPAARQTSFIGASAYGAAAVMALWGLLRQRPRLVYGAAAAATAVFLFCSAAVLHPAIARHRSAAPLLEEVPELAADRPVLTVDIRLPSLTFYLDRVPEWVTASELASRLRAADDPLVVIADVDLERVPSGVLVRLRELGRSGKLRVFAEMRPSEPPEGG